MNRLLIIIDAGLENAWGGWEEGRVRNQGPIQRGNHLQRAETHPLIKGHYFTWLSI